VVLGGGASGWLSWTVVVGDGGGRRSWAVVVVSGGGCGVHTLELIKSWMIAAVAFLPASVAIISAVYP